MHSLRSLKKKKKKKKKKEEKNNRTKIIVLGRPAFGKFADVYCFKVYRYDAIFSRIFQADINFYDFLFDVLGEPPPL